MFGPAGDEEFDEWDLVHVAGQHREKRRRRFLVSALVEGVDDDECWNLHRLERTDNELFHLRTDLFSSNSRVGPQDLEQRLSKRRVPICELKSERWEDPFNVIPVLEVPRAKETCSELPLRERDLGERLGDGRLSGPREAVEPENALALLVLQPIFELLQDIPPRPPQAPLPVPRAVAGPVGVMDAVQKDPFHVSLFTSYYGGSENKEARLTMSCPLLS